MTNNPPSLPSLGMAGLFPHFHYLTDEEKQHLQAGSDGNTRMFYNGIFNTPDEAARNAVQLADNENEPLYFTYFPKAEDMLVEVGIAIYEYLGGGSNSTKKFQKLVHSRGNDGLLINAYSRGSLTVGNGMRDFEERGVHGISQKTDIYLLGPADNSLSIANAHYYVSDGKKDHIYLQNHIFDPIGTGIGHNPPTAYKVPLEFPYVLFPPATPMREIWGVLAGHDPSTHNCYGDASSKCQNDYGSFDFIKVYSTRTGNKK